MSALAGEAMRKRWLGSQDRRGCRRWRMIARLLLLLIAPGATGSALAQGGNADSKALIERAKAEGTVMIYSSVAVDDMAVLTAAFEKKYSIKVRLWRGSSETIVQRSMVEARGGRFDVDLIETGAMAMEALRREMLLRQVDTPAAADLIPAAVLPHREWIGTRFNIFA